MKNSASRILLWSLVVLVTVTNVIGRTHAADSCCAHCGGADGCRKVCRLVCENKKVTVTCWGCKSEDFCVNCPSTLCQKHCEMVCGDDTDPKAPCTQPKKFVWGEWIPGGAKIYTRSKLMKRTITKTVPSFKWVVEELCPDCEALCPVAEVPPGVEVPPPPVTNAKPK